MPELKDWNLDEVTSKPATTEISGPSIKFYRIFNPTQGTDPNQVIGRDCVIESVSIRGIFQYRPEKFIGAHSPMENNLTDCYVRYIVFVDKQPVLEGDADLADDLLQPQSYAMTAFKNLDWTNRFDVLVDDTFKMKPGKWFPKNVTNGDSRAVAGSLTTNYTLYGRVNNASNTVSTILNNDSVDPPEPFKITGVINQVEEATVEGSINFDPELSGAVKIPYDFKGGIGEPVPCGHIEISGRAEGEVLVPPIPSVFQWQTGLTPGRFNTLAGVSWFHGDMFPEGLAPLDFGSVSNMNFTTNVELPNIKWNSEMHLDLPKWEEHIPPDPNTPGLHGEMLTGVQLNIDGRWTGSSELKSWWIKPKLVWQKDWHTGKITANDLKVCIIVDTPIGIGGEDVFTAYLSSRIRYRDD